MNTFLEFLKNHKYTVLFVLIGLLLTILFFTIGFWRTVLIALLASAGFLFGKYEDGALDPASIPLFNRRR